MTPEDIKIAIERARKGIAQYAHLMETFPRCDVACDLDFQRNYNAFYRVQRRKECWYRSYYALMQGFKGSLVTFDSVLDAIFQNTGRYEPSFASKLVATLDPSKPVWDVHVLANTGHPAPSYSHASKISLAKVAYKSITHWYADFLESSEGQLCVSEFNRLVPEHIEFTSLKKVDFILWQTRVPRLKQLRPKPSDTVSQEKQRNI